MVTAPALPVLTMPELVAELQRRAGLVVTIATTTSEPSSRRRSDRDWWTNRADGCDLHARCLSCPLPRCRLDMHHSELVEMVRAGVLLYRLLDGQTLEQAAEAIGMLPDAGARVALKWFPVWDGAGA